MPKSDLPTLISSEPDRGWARRASPLPTGVDPEARTTSPLPLKQ